MPKSETFQPSEPAPEQANVEPAKEPVPEKIEPKFTKGANVTYREKPAVITHENADGSFDVQLVDAAGEAVRDINDQPQWTPSVAASELTAR